jgi:hypothetical protein
MPPVIGSPVQAFVDALKRALLADATLVALVTGVYGYVPEASRTDFPYLVLGMRTSDRDAGAMTLPGANVTVQLDGWSDHKGASEIEAILSRVAFLFERGTLALSGGYSMIVGSLTCEFQQVFVEPDADMPEQLLYHGLQRWRATIDG